MVSREDLTKKLNDGFANMSFDAKLAFTLFYYEDLTVSEIACILDKSVYDINRSFLTAKIIMRKYTDIFDKIDRHDTSKVSYLYQRIDG